MTTWAGDASIDHRRTPGFVRLAALAIFDMNKVTMAVTLLATEVNVLV